MSVLLVSGLCVKWWGKGKGGECVYVNMCVNDMQVCEVYNRSIY